MTSCNCSLPSDEDLPHLNNRLNLTKLRFPLTYFALATLASLSGCTTTNCKSVSAIFNQCIGLSSSLARVPIDCSTTAHTKLLQVSCTPSQYGFCMETQSSIAATDFSVTPRVPTTIAFSQNQQGFIAVVLPNNNAGNTYRDSAGNVYSNCSQVWNALLGASPVPLTNIIGVAATDFTADPGTADAGYFNCNDVTGCQANPAQCLVTYDNDFQDYVKPASIPAGTLALECVRLLVDYSHTDFPAKNEFSYYGTLGVAVPDLNSEPFIAVTLGSGSVAIGAPWTQFDPP